VHGKATEMAPFAAPVDCVTGSPVFAEDSATFSVLTVPSTPEKFRPSKPLSPLPGVLTTTPGRVLAKMARDFNGSEFATVKRRWLVIQAAGGLVELNNIPEDQLPDDPDGLPFVLEEGLAKNEAYELAHRENAKLLAVARVPRIWHVVTLEVASLPAQAAKPKSEGGAA
jgi:hypothetical protein